MMKKILLLILCIFLLTSCSDYKELKDIDIITGIGVDYEDNEYTVTLEILKSKASGDKEETETVLVSSSDEIFSNAFESNYTKISKDPYFSHLEVLFISEDVCKEKGIQEIADFLLRTFRTNNSFYTVVTKDSSAYDILDNKQDNTSVSSTVMELLQNSNNNSFIDVDNQFDSLVGKLLEKGSDIYLPSVSLDDEDFQVSEIALFDGFEMKDYLDSEYSTVISLATMKTTNDIYFNDGINSIDIYKSSNKYEVKEDKIIITLNLYATIKSLEDKYSLRDKETYHFFEDTFKDKIKNDLENAIESLREKESDLLGLGNKYYKKYPKKYYEEVGNEIDYEVKVNLTVNKFGILFEVIK